MIEILVAIVLLAAVFAVLAYPLYQSRPQLEFANAGTLNDLLAQRDGVYATLRDLDLDYQLGKLDAADYQARRERYLARASVLLQQLDALRGADAAHRDLSDEIEREVAVLRRQTASSGSQRAESKRQPAKRMPAAANGRRPGVAPAVAASEKEEEEVSFCTNCGRARKPGERYCAKCGHALT